jgi:hypothetical protein
VSFVAFFVRRFPESSALVMHLGDYRLSSYRPRTEFHNLTLRVFHFFWHLLVYLFNPDSTSCFLERT